MKLKKSEKILLSVMAFTVTFYILNTFVFSKKEEKPVLQKAKSVAKLQGQVEKKAQLDIQTLLQPRNNRPSKLSNVSQKVFTNWMRDPFLGAYTSELLDSLREKPPEQYVLKAISWKDSVAYVIINNDVYKQGELKNGIKVLKVIGNKVVFTVNGRKKAISFGG